MDRERHVALWSDDLEFEHEGHRNYDRFADQSGERLDIDAIAADIEATNGLSSAVEAYVNEHVAHRAAEQAAEIPTFAEVPRQSTRPTSRNPPAQRSDCF